MSESGCIPVESLARVRDLPAGAAERRHAEHCPRCRAALLALAEFERGAGSLPVEADAAGANARLDAVIESLTAPGTAAPVPRRGGPGWLRELLAPPALRFAAGLAVVAIVAASAWLLARGPLERLERGDSAGAGAPVVRALGAGWELSWPEVEGAEAYDVVFLSPDLRVLGRVRDVRGPRLALAPGSLPEGVAPGAPVLVEIAARAGGAVLRVSAPAPIELK